jgi:PAS domain S-box-containing protein
MQSPEKTNSRKTGVPGSVTRRSARRPATSRARPATAGGRAQSAAFAQLKLESVFETSPEPLAISRASDGAHIAVNRAWCETTGHRREQAIGRSALELGLWADPRERERLLAWLEQHGPVSGFQTRFVRADGSTMEVTLSCRRTELDGEPCLTYAWRDNSNERRIARRVAASEERFSKAFYASPDAIVIGRLEDGRIVEANLGFERLTGYSAEEALGKSALELGIYPSAELHERMLHRLRDGRPIRDFEGFVRTRSGAQRVVRYSVERLMLGDADYGIAVMQDVTEERSAAQALTASERRYRALFHHAHDPIALVSPEGRILEANPAFCTALGESCEALVGRSILTLFADSDAAREAARLAYLLEHGVSRGERTVRRSDGSTFDVEVSAWLLPDGNIQTIARDISARKRGDALMRKAARSISAHTGTAFFRSVVQFLCDALEADMAFVGELLPDGAHVRTLTFCRDGVLAENFEYALAGSPCVEAFDRTGVVVHPRNAAQLFPLDEGLRTLGVQGYAGTSLYRSNGDPLGILVVLTRVPIEHPQQVERLLEICAARTAAEIERARDEAGLRARIATLEAQRVKARRVGTPGPAPRTPARR